MIIDKTTFSDISVFNTEEEFSIFHKLNFTRTSIGKDWLKYFFSEPFRDKERILSTQKIISAFQKYLHILPQDISNGTILVMSKYLDYDLDEPPSNPGMVTAMLYKTFHQADHSIIRFSIRHFADFFRDLKQMAELLIEEDLPLS